MKKAIKLLIKNYFIGEKNEKLTRETFETVNQIYLLINKL